MHFSREIRRMLIGILVVLAMIGFSATYWAIAGQDSLLLRGDNPRLFEALARIQRGSIHDRNGQVLAETVDAGSGLERRYTRPSTYSIVGYYSLRYGVGGAEAAYEEALSGAREVDSLEDYFNTAILRRRQVGSDIMLTLDAEIQDSLVAAVDGLWGAAVVMDAQTGDILALSSLPSYDPNSLDEDWSKLIDEVGNPFFNRALQGHYQPGGSLYVLWLADAVQSGFDVTARLEGAADALDLSDGTTVGCVVAPPVGALSLTDALVYGCPAGFDSYRRTESAAPYQDLVSQFGFMNPVTLAGFPSPEPIAPLASPGDDEVDLAAMALRRALGQGDLTTSPLHLAAVMAAIVNDGRAVAPRIHYAQRQAQANDWITQPVNVNARQVMDAPTARELRRVLAEAWSTLAGQPVLAEAQVGAYLAMSQAGDDTQLWLNGFHTSAGDNKVAFVVVLENVPDLSNLLGVGQALIEALHDKR